MERETGLEPATSSLGSWHSTTELLPHLSETDIYHQSLPLCRSACSDDASPQCRSSPLSYILPHKRWQKLVRRWPHRVNEMRRRRHKRNRRFTSMGSPGGGR